MRPPTEENRELGRRIRVIRKRLGLSQEEFAERVGVSRVQISMWENGYNKPQPTNLQKIVALGGGHAGDLYVNENETEFRRGVAFALHQIRAACDILQPERSIPVASAQTLLDLEEPTTEEEPNGPY